MSRIESPSRAEWRKSTEGVNRGDLIEVLNAAARNSERTPSEQEALLRLIDKIDVEILPDMELLRLIAEHHWTRSHRCECGKVTPGYWCSDACQRFYDIGTDGDAA